MIDLDDNTLDTYEDKYQSQSHSPSIYRHLYGEILTPLSFVKTMISHIPNNIWEDMTNVWIDPGSGRGSISIYIYYKLMFHLENSIPDLGERKTHIVTKMLVMVDINECNVIHLRSIFGNKANIYHGDFLSHDVQKQILTHNPSVVICNPPFHHKHKIKVPTNRHIDKVCDGEAIWVPFVKASVQLLRDAGIAVFIIPSLWCKLDKKGCYTFLTYTPEICIEHVTFYSNTETNAIFNKQAQTPTTLIQLRKIINKQETTVDNVCNINVHDKINNSVVLFPLYTHCKRALPSNGVRIIRSIQAKMTAHRVESLRSFTKKTNMPSKQCLFNDNVSPSSDYPYANIHSCIVRGSLTDAPLLTMQFSNIPLPYSNDIKIILAHKMYGVPFYDKDGKYGISNRDNYVIRFPEQLIKMKNQENDIQLSNGDIYDLYTHLFKLPCIQFLLTCTTYRMRCIEIYAFDYIPCVHLLPGFPNIHTMTNKSVMRYFEFTKSEEEYVNNHHSKGVYQKTPTLAY